jgi:Tol biopolymer transport system component
MLTRRSLFYAILPVAVVAGTLGAVNLAGQETRAIAAFPGSVGRIAFESDRTGNSEIYLMSGGWSGIDGAPIEVDPGKNLARITSSPADDSEPSWGWFGSNCNEPGIAFQSNRDGDYDIWIMRPDGSSVQKLTNNRANDNSPAWLKNEGAIIFESDRTGSMEIYSMAPDGSQQTRLTHNRTYDGNPAWSARGIVFESNRDGNLEIWVMDRDGSNVQQLTRGPRDHRNPSWYQSEEGNDYLTFDALYGRNTEIGRLALGTNKTDLLSRSPHEDSAPVFAPNGEEMAFHSTRDGNYEVYIMDANGREQTRLTMNRGNDINPEYEPTCFLADPNPNPPRVPPKGGFVCTKTGSNGPNTLIGTSGPDVLCGGGGNDRLKGRGGRDVIQGGPGRDRIRAGGGADRIYARDATRDRVSGGGGSDRGLVDRGRDRVRRVEAFD